MTDKSIGIIPLAKDENNKLVCLAVQHAGGHWGVPKGHPESGESIYETIHRELVEETGLSVKHVLEDPVFLNTYTFEKEGITIHKETTYHLALMEKKNPIIPMAFQKEILQAVWMPFNELMGLIEHADAKVLLDKISQYLEEHERELLESASLEG